MSLCQAPHGQTMTVIRVAADGKTRRHLENLGIMTGAELTPIALTDGNMILRVHDSRIAINKELAESITVRTSPIFA